MSGVRYRTLKIKNRMLIPVILMMGFVPLIVHLYEYESGLAQFDWFPSSSDVQADFFFAWKMYAIIILGVVMAAVLLYRHFQKHEKLLFENSFYLLFFYALFVGMSALFSQYKHWVSAGTFELFESVWVVFVYMIVCYYTYQYVQEEKQVYVLLRWAGVGALIVTLIGVFQTFGLDFFKTTIGKMSILNPSDWNLMDQVSFVMAEGTAYTTLYNPNYLSFYFGMLIPLLACLFVAAKKLKYRIGLAAAEVLALICLKGSGSDSGWMAVVIGVGIVAVVLCSRTKKSRIAIGAVAAVGVAALIIVCMTTTGGQLLVDTIAGTFRLEDRVAVWSIDTTEDSVVLDINGNDLYISCGYDESGELVISCQDSDGNAVSTVRTDESTQTDLLDDSRYYGNRVTTVDEAGNVTEEYAASCGTAGTVRPSEYGEGFYFYIDGIGFDFLKGDDGAYYYLNPSGELIDLDVEQVSRLFRDDAMSYRGRIWNNTIPVLRKYVFIGSGANTYLFATTQTDYIYKTYIGELSSYDVKAHCWYLQQWVENGLIAALLLIGFCLWYIVRSIRIYRRVSLSEPFTWVGIGLFAAVLVYLTAALVNDSNVGTAPVFWCILGLGLAVNRMIAGKEKIFEPAAEAEAIQEKKDTPAVTAEQQISHTAQTSGNASAKGTGKKQSKKKRKKKKK